jgi:hypothetical protein
MRINCDAAEDRTDYLQMQVCSYVIALFSEGDWHKIVFSILCRGKDRTEMRSASGWKLCIAVLTAGDAVL